MCCNAGDRKGARLMVEGQSRLRRLVGVRARVLSRWAAVALGVALTVSAVNGASAAPESIIGGNPTVTLNVSPNDGDNLSSPQAITVTGGGFGSGLRGDIFQCATVDGSDACVRLGDFTSSGGGTFSVPVNVTSTFQGLNASNVVVPVNCLQVACRVQAETNNFQFFSQHHISFAGASIPTSTTTTTRPATTTSSTTTTTLPPTTTTAPTTTTLPPTTPPANPLCSTLLQTRSQISATLDALGSSFPAFRPFAAQVLALLDQFIALFGCGGDSVATAAASPRAGLPTGNGLNIGDLLGATGFGQPAARSEQAVTGEYVVVPGDTLFALSQRLFGDGDLYPTLIEMNQDQIDDADLLIPGQVLRIPVVGTG